MQKKTAFIVIAQCIVLWALTFCLLPLMTGQFDWDEYDRWIGFPIYREEADWRDIGRITSRYFPRNLIAAGCISGAPSILWSSLLVLGFYPALRPRRWTWQRLAMIAAGCGLVMALRYWLPAGWQWVEGTGAFGYRAPTETQEVVSEIAMTLVLLFGAAIGLGWGRRRWERGAGARATRGEHDWPFDTLDRWDEPRDSA